MTHLALDESACRAVGAGLAPVRAIATLAVLDDLVAACRAVRGDVGAATARAVRHDGRQVGANVVSVLGAVELVLPIQPRVIHVVHDAPEGAMLGGRRKRVESVEIVPDLVRERDPGPGGFGLRLPTRDVGHTPVCDDAVAVRGGAGLSCWNELAPSSQSR